ncbi:MAG: hydroxyacylglutathione hydrolase [Chitinivibrionales bacterium]
MHILPVPYAADNYAYLIIEQKRASVVDPGNAKAISDSLQKHDLTLEAILLTHHHSDHVGGAARLSKATGATIYAPNDKRIRPVDVKLHDGDRVEVPGATFEVIKTPGHTKKHMVYFCRMHRVLFSGDALFGAGCGRIFEGSVEQMYDSLMVMAALGEDVRVYFGHEYTEENLRFALSIEPDSLQVSARLEKVRELLRAGEWTTPSFMGEELQTNPFLRADTESVRRALGMPDSQAHEVFGKLRKKKDSF